MKALLGPSLCLGIALSAGSAMAIDRYDATTLNCANARQILRDKGAAIFRYPSQRVKGMVLYDRYVRNTQSCDNDQYAERATIPTRDNLQCPVLNCQPLSNLNDNWPSFIPHNSL
ncbi:hypothetical protein [Rhizobium sp.]|uniref:hypothetical protein n=1 Tax=Rhizobium sp. TaxID=391 RepID=UPI000E990B5D|nr:hypothetical protein [Rhizobium sp.]